MPPAMRLASTTDGRSGSLNWTETRSPLCARAGLAVASTQRMNNATELLNDECLLVMTFKNSNVSIEIFYSDLRTTIADTPSCVAVRAKDQLAVAALFFDRLLRQRGKKK